MNLQKRVDFIRVFIANAVNSPDMRVVDAVRISMSIPLAFRPVVSADKTFWVDGGTMHNYPVELFDKQPDYKQRNTLGFILSSRENIENPRKVEITNEFDYAGAVANSLMSVQTADTFRSANAERTVFIDCGNIGTLDFALTKEQKEALLRSGAESTKAFLRSNGYAQ